jgi:hypothetical protein
MTVCVLRIFCLRMCMYTTNMCTPAYVHVCLHTCMYVCICPCMLAYVHVCFHTCIYVTKMCMPAYVYVCLCIYSCLCNMYVTKMLMPACVHICLHMCMYACVCVCMPALVYVCLRMCMYTDQMSPHTYACHTHNIHRILCVHALYAYTHTPHIDAFFILNLYWSKSKLQFTIHIIHIHKFTSDHTYIEPMHSSTATKKLQITSELKYIHIYISQTIHILYVCTLQHSHELRDAIDFMYIYTYAILHTCKCICIYIYIYIYINCAFAPCNKIVSCGSTSQLRRIYTHTSDYRLYTHTHTYTYVHTCIHILYLCAIHT